MRSQVELTQLCWAGKNLRRVGTLIIDTADIVARAEMDHHSVLYLRSGEKLLVQERLDQIERMTVLSEAQRETIKRFKRDIRECKSMGLSIDQAFAALWEEIATGGELDEEQQAYVYKELLDWTKRWLK